MRIRMTAMGALIVMAGVAGAQAPAELCREKPCAILFDYGGRTLDVDKVYGATSDLETGFAETLKKAGYQIVASGQAMTLTLRVKAQAGLLCASIPGTDPDYSCQTATSAQLVFSSGDSSITVPKRIEITARCRDVKAFPTMHQFGEYAAQWTLYMLADRKGQRPTLKCG